MSLAAMHWARNQMKPGERLKQGPRLALLLLALEADSSNSASVCIDALADEMGVSDRSAQRATLALRRAGLIDIEERFKPDGTQLPNKYHLNTGCSYER